LWSFAVVLKSKYNGIGKERHQMKNEDYAREQGVGAV